MKAFKDYDEIKAASEFEPIPAGGYIAKIMGAEVKEYDWGSMLFVSIDISDGDYKDYYANDYRNQQSEDKRWKGILRQFIPKDDGSDKDQFTKACFKAMIQAVEDSNNGYHWDWNEQGLKGKIVGLLLRNEEWEYNGKTGWKAQPFKFIDVEKIKAEEYKIPKDKPLANKQQADNKEDFEELESDMDLPFN